MSVWVYHATQPFDLENGWEQAEYNFTLPSTTHIDIQSGARSTDYSQYSYGFCRSIDDYVSNKRIGILRSDLVEKEKHTISSAVNSNVYLGVRLDHWTVEEGLEYYDEIVNTKCPELNEAYTEIFTLDTPDLQTTGELLCTRGVGIEHGIYSDVGYVGQRLDASVLIWYRLNRELREVYCPETIERWSDGIVTTQTNKLDSLFDYRLPWRPRGYHQGETSTGFKWWNHFYP